MRMDLLKRYALPGNLQAGDAVFLTGTAAGLCLEGQDVSEGLLSVRLIVDDDVQWVNDPLQGDCIKVTVRTGDGCEGHLFIPPDARIRYEPRSEVAAA